MIRWLMRTVGFLALLALVIAALLSALALLLSEMMIVSPAFQRLVCNYGPALLCPRPAVVQQVRPENPELKDRNGDLERIFNRMAQLEAAAESFTVFHQDNDGPHAVVSGHNYSSLLTEGALLGAYCYVFKQDAAGVKSRIDLATMDARFDVDIQSVAPEAWADLGLRASDRNGLLARCKWPGRGA